MFREDLDCIPVPQPQNYHNYCQICVCTYENYEQHILTDVHMNKSRNQAQLADIDNIIEELEQDKRWNSNRMTNAKKDTLLSEAEISWVIHKDGRRI